MKRREALDLFAADLRERGCTEGTVARLVPVARRFLASTPNAVSRLVPSDVRSYLAECQRAGLAATTQQAELSYLRSFFGALMRAAVLAHDPCEGFGVRATRGADRRPPSEEGVRKILAMASVAPPHRRRFTRPVTLRDRAVCELAYGVGLRASELVAIRVLDLRLAEGHVVVRPVKGGTPRVLPLPSASLPHLHAYLTKARPALLGATEDHGHYLVTQTGQPATRDLVLRTVKNVAARAGFHAFPHLLRHALATHLIRRKVSVRVVQLLLGHARLASTAEYLDLDRADLHRVVALLELDTTSPGLEGLAR